MSATESKFDWNSLRNLFLGLIFIVILLPLIILLFFASQYKAKSVKTANTTKSKLASNITNNPATETQEPPAKIVLINPVTNKATYNAKDEDEQVNSPTTSTQVINSSTTPTSPPTAPPPNTPTVTVPLTEFTGTVISISGNTATFSYGNANSVAIILTKTSPSSLPVGTKAHVHSRFSNGQYYEDEIEIL